MYLCYEYISYTLQFERIQIVHSLFEEFQEFLMFDQELRDDRKYRVHHLRFQYLFGLISRLQRPHEDLFLKKKEIEGERELASCWKGKKRKGLTSATRRKVCT